MANRKVRFMEKILMGKEKSEGYARSTLPSNRWELFWDIVKGRFGKVVLLNIIVFAFALPIIALIVMRNFSVVGMGASYPFSSPLGIGYLAPSSVEGFSSQIAFRSNLFVFLFLPLAFVIFGVGLSGGAYVARNMIWTEGIFIANDFWLGIKRNFKHIVLICLIYSFFFYISAIGSSLLGIVGNSYPNIAWLTVVGKVFIYAVMAFITLVALHMVAMTVTYEVGFGSLIKNAVVMTVSFIPLNIIFVAAGIIPFLLIPFGGILMVIGTIASVLVGFSFFLLIWTDYCQWIYDSHINKKRGYATNRGIYGKVKETDAEAVKLYKKQIDPTTASVYASRPIKPITDDDLRIEELPEAFGRADLERLSESKQRIYEDHAKYVEEHKDDPQFEKFKAANSEKAVAEREKRIADAKKELSKREKKKGGKK